MTSIEEKPSHKCFVLMEPKKDSLLLLVGINYLQEYIPDNRNLKTDTCGLCNMAGHITGNMVGN